MWTRLLSYVTSLPGLQVTVFSLCLHVVFLLYVSGPKSDSYKDTNHRAELGPTLKTSF